VRLLVEGGDKVPGGIVVEQGRVIVGRDLHPCVLVAHEMAGEVDRLERDTAGVGESLPHVEGGILGEELIGASLVLPEVVVLVAEEVAGVVHTLERDAVASCKTMNNAEARVLVVEVATLVLVGPGLVVPVADVVLGVVVRANGHGGVDQVPGGIVVEQGRVVVGRDLHACVLVANEVAGEVDRLEGHSTGISKSLPQLKTGVLPEELIMTLVLPEIVVLVAKEVAGVVGALERDAVSSSQSGDDPESRILPVEVAILGLIRPRLVVPVADVELGVVVRSNLNLRHPFTSSEKKFTNEEGTCKVETN